MFKYIFIYFNGLIIGLKFYIIMDIYRNISRKWIMLKWKYFVLNLFKLNN